MGALHTMAEPSGPAMDDLLLELNSAIDVEQFWRASLRLVERLLPFHSCSLMSGLIGKQPSSARHHVAFDPLPGYRPASSLSVAGDYLYRNPQLKLYTFSQIVSSDPAARSRRMEQERAAQGQWSEFVHLAFWDGERPDAVLSIRRHPGQGEFHSDELAALARLHPWFDAGLRRLRALTRERSSRLAMERMLSALPLPVMCLDDDLQVICASQEAYEACAQWNFGVRARPLNARYVYRLPAQIADRCVGLLAGEDGESKVLHPEDDGIEAQLAISQPLRNSWGKQCVLVSFSVRQNMDGVSVAESGTAIACLQQLSPCERRVARLVVEGLSNRRIAKLLGKSQRTIDSQVGAVYRKLDVSNRVQLSRLLA